MTGKYFGGCDIGSTTGKAVIIDENGKICADAIIPSEIDPEKTSVLVLEKACAGIPDLGDYKTLAYLVGTGYGRNEVPFAQENISEISCHAMGAFSCNSRIRTIVDVGGQDVKAVSLNDNGSVLEFAMNDKCAAGTGRFFEAMSRVFRMELEQFAALSLNAKRVTHVTSQCSVFAESEVVSLLAKRNPPEEIAAGIQSAVSKRCFSLLKKVGLRPSVTITGGCAKNPGLIKSLSGIINMEIENLSFDPQLIGALGAAVYAGQRA